MLNAFDSFPLAANWKQSPKDSVYLTLRAPWDGSVSPFLPSCVYWAPVVHGWAHTSWCESVRASCVIKTAGKQHTKRIGWEPGLRGSYTFWTIWIWMTVQVPGETPLWVLFLHWWKRGDGERMRNSALSKNEGLGALAFAFNPCDTYFDCSEAFLIPNRQHVWKTALWLGKLNLKVEIACYFFQTSRSNTLERQLVENPDFEVRLFEFTFWLYPILVVWYWVSHITFLCLSFL